VGSERTSQGRPRHGHRQVVQVYHRGPHFELLRWLCPPYFFFFSFFFFLLLVTALATRAYSTSSLLLRLLSYLLSSLLLLSLLLLALLLALLLPLLLWGVEVHDSVCQREFKNGIGLAHLPRGLQHTHHVGIRAQVRPHHSS